MRAKGSEIIYLADALLLTGRVASLSVLSCRDQPHLSLALARVVLPRNPGGELYLTTVLAGAWPNFIVTEVTFFKWLLPPTSGGHIKSHDGVGNR